MTFLQLHDGPSRMTMAGCNPAEVKKQFIPTDKAGWGMSIEKTANAQQVYKNYKSLVAASGTGSKPIYGADGAITGYAQANKGEVAMSWIQLGIQIGKLLKSELDNAGANRLTNDAQAAWDANLWGIQNLCNQDLQTLYSNTQKCYDALTYWLNRQSEAQTEFKNTPVSNLLKRNELNGNRRIANRAVVIRQNAFRLLNEQILEKGGNFTPGGAAQKVDLSKLVIPGILALITLR